MEQVRQGEALIVQLCRILYGRKKLAINRFTPVGLVLLDGVK